MLPGEPITMEDVLSETAITYPEVYVAEMTGAQIKAIMEDICDNLFNPDPYYQQGGDMVRVGGLRYTIDPDATIGHRISNMGLGGKAIEATGKYKVVGWAPVSEESKTVGGEPVWDVVARHLRSLGEIKARELNVPRIRGDLADPGMA